MIKFQTVTKKFPNGTVAFENLSFDVDPGEMVMITGPSGSGKTTIMRLIIREYAPTEGEIEFDDQPLNRIKNRDVPKHRQKIGVVFQDYKLINDLNVWENIALPLNIRHKSQQEIEERVTDLLKLINLTDKALMFPCQLSGGEAQRVSIARALATGPKIIFADEPTGNLDKATSQKIIDLLTKINKLGTTLMLATHDQFVLDYLQAKTIDLTRLTEHKLTKKNQAEKIEVEDLNEDNSEVKNQNDSKNETEEKIKETKKSKSKKDKKSKKTKNCRVTNFFKSLFKQKKEPKTDKKQDKQTDKDKKNPKKEEKTDKHSKKEK